MPSQSSSYAEPSYTPGSNDRGNGETGGTGVYSAYCVRLCDGRYFPIQRHAGASPAETCQSFCPASKTALFSGSKIDSAAGPRGERYADLDNAFVYREKLVDGCTCNGKDAFGLAHVDLKADPTLRPGDIVATNDGFATFRGKGASKTADFTPINPSSSAWAKHLAETKIKPAAVETAPAPTVVSNDQRAVRRSVQAAR